MVKFILSIRSQKNWPEDPHKHMTDFFGNYKDPMWDKMDEWREENEDIRQKHIPELTQKIADLQEELAKAKRQTFASNIFKGACEGDVTELGFKLLV